MATLNGPLFTINGIPAHPLLVHIVVVVLPLAALGAVLIAIFPRWRRRYWLPVLALSIVGIAAVPFTQNAGQQLLNQLGPLNNPDLQHHVSLGEGLLPYAVAFGVALLVLLIAGRIADALRNTGSDPDSPQEGSGGATVWYVITWIGAIAVIVTAVLLVIQLVLIGDAGSSAVWKGIAGG